MKSSVFSTKGFRRLVVASAAVLGTAAASHSFAAPASTTATTTATVVTPIAIAKAQDLSFGQFAAGTGGTVVLTTAGAKSKTGDVVLTAGTSTAAQFTVTGQADASFSIGITDNDLTHSTDALQKMSFVTTHDLGGGAANNPSTGTLTGGTQTIFVGGTLTVGSAQTVGTYNGTVTAEVNYN